MVRAILDGTALSGVGHGWFRGPQSRYGWTWLATHADRDQDGAVTLAEFAGTERDFDRLDRDRDHAIRADDLDWSEQSSYQRQGDFFRRHFRRIDTDGDGRVTPSEWNAAFAAASDGKDHLTATDFRAAGVLPADPEPPPLLARPSPKRGQPAPDDRTFAERWATIGGLLTSLIRGDLGVASEGPAVGDPAPDFTLATADGTRQVTLSQVIGPRPVVLIFGNYTCGPFRTAFPRIEDLRRQYGDRATFLLIYTREAHPIGGWQADDAGSADPSIAQPRTYPARVAVAERCSVALRSTLPILVDTLDDRVSYLYSGPPSRLYIIDRAGAVAYKGGRGPFGLRPEELEQALILTLQAESKSVPPAETPVP